MRIKHVTKFIFAHFNINLLRNKFELLAKFVIDKVNILNVSETCWLPNGPV